MPEHRTRGLVLRTFDQGESDRLVHLYTERLGRVSAIAKGARRSRRRFPGLLEIFSVLELELFEPPRASLMRLDGAVLSRCFEGLAAELGRYAIGCQLLEILDRLTGEREANPDLYHFAVGVLDLVEREKPDRLLALLVVTKTLARLGYRPQLVRCALCGRPLESKSGPVSFALREGGTVCSRCVTSGEARIPAKLLAAVELGIRSPLRERDELGLDAREVREAEALLERFFRFHVGLELKTAEFMRHVVPLGHLDGRGSPGDTPRAP